MNMRRTAVSRCSARLLVWAVLLAVYFLAHTDRGSSKVKTLIRLTGAQPFSIFKHRIDQLLAAQPEPDAQEATQK